MGAIRYWFRMFLLLALLIHMDVAIGHSQLNVGHNTNHRSTVRPGGFTAVTPSYRLGTNKPPSRTSGGGSSDAAMNKNSNDNNNNNANTISFTNSFGNNNNNNRNSRNNENSRAPPPAPMQAAAPPPYGVSSFTRNSVSLNRVATQPVVTTSRPQRNNNKQQILRQKEQVTKTTTTTTPPPTTPPPFEEEEEEVDDVDPHEWEVRLFRELFEERGYSNRARPARRYGPVDVTLQLVVLKINEILEIDQEIVISGFLKINWTDFRLAWNKEDFGNIERVVTEVGNIWLPDLALINSDDVYAITRDGRFPITLTSSGSMLYVPAGKISARCELNLQYFPFDSQTCLFRFESWVYNEKAVRVFGLNLTIDGSHFIQNPQWAIIDSNTRTTVAEYDSANFSRVDFLILLQRKSLFFLTYTVFPCGIISCLQMFSHILPLTESERVNFGTTTLVAFAVFHISVVEQVPKSSDSIPLLAIYVDSLMFLIGLSLVESFLMMNWLTHVGYYTVPEPWAFYHLVEIMGPYIWLGQAGLHWRRNYLRVLLKVRARSDEIKRRERDLEHLANKASKGRPGGKEGRARRMSYCSHIYRGYSSRNVAALIKLMVEYGDLVADLNHNSILRYHNLNSAGNFLAPASPSRVVIANNNNNNNGSNLNRNESTRLTHSDDESSTSKKGITFSDDTVIEMSYCNNSAINKANTVVMAANNIASSPAVKITTKTNSAMLTNGDDLHLHHEGSNGGPDNNKKEMNFFTTLFGLPMMPQVNFSPLLNNIKESTTGMMMGGDKTNQNLSSPLLGSRLKEQRPVVSVLHHHHNATNNDNNNNNNSNQQVAADISNEHDKIGDSSTTNVDDDYNNNKFLSPNHSCRVSSPNIDAVRAQLERQLEELNKIGGMLGEIKGSVGHHSLKRECLGVWTVYITAVDRILSAFILLCSLVIPIYLFWIYPKNISRLNDWS